MATGIDALSGYLTADRGHDAGSLAISEWVTTAFFSALSIKLRSKHIEISHRADALHLAICFDHAVGLCTLDRRLADAGPLLGLKTQLV